MVSVEGICSPDHAGQSAAACCCLLGREGSQARSWLRAWRGGWEVRRQRWRPLFSRPQLRREILDCSLSALESSLVAAFLPSPSQTGTRELAGERASGDEQWQHAGG